MSEDNRISEQDRSAETLFRIENNLARNRETANQLLLTLPPRSTFVHPACGNNEIGVSMPIIDNFDFDFFRESEHDVEVDVRAVNLVCGPIEEILFFLIGYCVFQSCVFCYKTLNSLFDKKMSHYDQ